MIWEVFRQAAPGRAHEHCGNVHAPDREMAKQFAVIQHGRRKPTHSLWVAPQERVSGVYGDEDAGSVDGETDWAVFRQDRAGGYHAHCGQVTADDVDAAKAAAGDAYGDDDPNSLWLVQSRYIGEVTDKEVAFGGTTNKAYRFAQTYNVDAAAEEVQASENEQIDAERRRGDS
ncbi:PacF protein [Halolamina sp. CBA1230]|uniref:PacF protein n=1 Tax=Halolamina sp. CBA1230 TaxID=1853690 RepID=UPI0009A25432|nr:PacF protein [Halolamina sp. CBA1230]QKY19043.1 PacF protein [Halolamina sp. CBA1230]